jgi:hypothetical protein
MAGTMLVGSPTMQASGRDARVAHVGDQLTHAKAAHLFVVAEGKVHRKRRVTGQELRRMGHAQSQ